MAALMCNSAFCFFVFFGSGKALKGMIDDMRASPEEWEDKAVLFVHTGGLLGMYEKISQLQPLFGKWNRMAL